MARCLCWAVPVLLTAIASGCSGSAQMPSSGGHAVAVPWIDRPAPRYQAPPPRVQHYSTKAPPCRARQLAVRQRRMGVGLGNVLERFTFLNLGNAPCLLRGFPTVTGVTANGIRRSVLARRSPDGTYFGTLVPADISAGERGFLDFATGEGCRDPLGSARRYRALVFALPARGGLVSAPESSLVMMCGFLKMSQFGLPAPQPMAPTPKPGTPDTLTVSVAMPATVRAGTTLRFVVTLANPTRISVRLAPCPRYNEGIYTIRGRVSRWYWLNCEQVRSIAAHALVRYAMALPLPTDVPAGLAKFWWALGTPNEPLGGAGITITRKPPRPVARAASSTGRA
jgi:hypothetical protein